MKNLILIPTLAATLMMSSLAMAKSRHHDAEVIYDNARVTRVEPIYRSVEYVQPRRECNHSEVIYDDRPRRGHTAAGEMIVGALVGGVIANEMHGGTNAKIAGAAIGSAIGHDVASKRHRPQRDYAEQRRCSSVSERRRGREIDGYRVHYRYAGEQFVTRMDHDPGRYIQVRVDVRPQRHRF